MKSLCVICVSCETADFLADEIGEMLKHVDLSETMTAELGEILGGIRECDEIRIQIGF